MKKRTIGITTLLLSLVVLSGCVGTNAIGVLDESVPEQALVNLELRNDLSISLYNNQPVDWGPSGLTQSRTTISIPPGNHKLLVTWRESVTSNGWTQHYTKTKEIEHEFQAGNNYRIYMQKIWLVFFTLKDVKIKEIT